MTDFKKQSIPSDKRVFAPNTKPGMIDMTNEQARRWNLLDNEPDDQKIIILKTTNQERQNEEIPHSIDTTNYKVDHQQRAATSLGTLIDGKERNIANEISSFQARPYSAYQVPPKINLLSEHEAIQAQWLNSNLLSRPASRASSTRAATIERDLLDNEAKLIKDIEEMERKPYSPQQMIVDRHERETPSFNQWYMTDRGDPRHVDNKSPLPFAFDNFSTKGVRGNISSVGAVEPDRPRPPIYPIVRRSPTPNNY